MVKLQNQRCGMVDSGFGPRFAVVCFSLAFSQYDMGERFQT